MRYSFLFSVSVILIDMKKLKVKRHLDNKIYTVEKVILASERYNTPKLYVLEEKKAFKRERAYDCTIINECN